MRRLFCFSLLIASLSITQAKTQPFDVYFRGVSAGSATLTLPDVLEFPLLGSESSKAYEIKLTLEPNMLASAAGQKVSVSSSSGRLWASNIKPEQYQQLEDGKVVIKGVFGDEHVTVTDLKKNKEYVFDKLTATINDPLSLILNIQQGLRGQQLADEYVIVDNKRLNHFTVQKSALSDKRTRITLTSKKNADSFVFVFNVAYDLVEFKKLQKKKVILALKSK